MSWKRVASSALCILAAAVTTPASEYGIGLRAGTQGLGAEFGVKLSERFNLRGGYYKLSVTGDYDDTDITYDGKLKLGGLGVLADFYPLRSGFHLSAGLFANDNEVDLVATPTGPQEIGGTIYAPAQIGTLRGNVEFDSTAPYFGIGWGRLTGGSRVAFLFDLGLLKQGSGDVSLDSSTGLVSPDDLEAESREIEDDIDSYDFWPVISFGMAIRF